MALLNSDFATLRTSLGATCLKERYVTTGPGKRSTAVLMSPEDVCGLAGSQTLCVIDLMN